MQGKYAYCYDCNKPFIIPVLSRKNNKPIYCRFCNSPNVGNISKETYKKEIREVIKCSN